VCRSAGRAAGGHQAAVEGDDDGGGPVAQVEFGEDVVHVCLDRALAEDEPGCDLGVGQALPDEGEDVSLAWRECVEASIIGG